MINRAGNNLVKAYQDLREPVLKRVTVLLTVCLVVFLSLSVFTMWSVRRALNNDWQEMSEHSEQQKQDVQGLIDKAFADAKEAQIERESKGKMWDALMKTLTPQQRSALWEQVRDQMRKDGEKRLSDQMGAGYKQMTE
jgi:hypothetical protein